jgi:hypothetical protein
MAVFGGSALSVKVAYMAYFGRVHGRSDNQRKMSLRSDKEEVPGSSPGRPTTISTFIPQTRSVAILSFTLIFSYPEVS